MMQQFNATQQFSCMKQGESETPADERLKISAELEQTNH